MLDDATRRFLRRHIRSVWALDALLTLKRNAGQSWTADSLTAELRAARPMVSEMLHAFRAASLVQETPEGVRYAPADAGDAKAVETLDRLYAERPTALIREIMAAPSDRLQGFADAFKFRKD